MEPRRSNDACSEKLTQKRASCQQSIRQTKKRRETAVWIVRGEPQARCIACLGSLRSTKARFLVSSRLAQLPTSAAAAAFVVWVPLVASPKKHENRFCTYSQAHHAAMSPRENTGGDQLARPRLVHRGVGSSLRMMVQHARVVVVVAPSYYHRYHPYTILLLLLSPACCVSWCVRSRSSGA